MKNTVKAKELESLDILIGRILSLIKDGSALYAMPNPDGVRLWTLVLHELLLVRQTFYTDELVEQNIEQETSDET